MKNEEGIIHACRISRDGVGENFDAHDDGVLNSGDDRLLWVHLDSTYPASQQWLEQKSGLDAVVVQAMLTPEEEIRPRILVRDDGVMLVLRAINFQSEDEPEDMISLRIWISENIVVTAREQDIRAIGDLMGYIRRGEGPVCAGSFLTMITSRVFARMEPFLDELEAQTAIAEHRVADNSGGLIPEHASTVRKRTAIFARHVRPQKAVLERLLNSSFAWFTELHREQIVESLDRVTRYVEELGELRERTTILNDEINNAHARRLNEITYIFSVAATIFLPLGFLTGLMGINVGGMPGVENSSAFWIFSALCVLIICLQVYIFKKKGWF